MDEQILAKIEGMEKKIDALWGSVERMRKYFLWTLIITVAAILLPLIGLAVIVPQFLGNYTSNFSL